MSFAQVGEYRELPGPKAAEWLRRSKKASVTSVQNELLVLDSRAYFRRLTVRDADGNYYMDWFCGAGVSNLGHGAQDIVHALARQINLGSFQYDMSVIPHTRGIELLERLNEVAPGSQPRKTFLSNSGTEAIEAAYKAVQSKRPARHRFIAFDGAFHGRTGYALPLNGSQEVHTRDFPNAYTVHHFPFLSQKGSLDALFHQAGTESLPLADINAVFIELVQGGGGINVADREELGKLVEWCHKNDIYLIVDEVQTGIGRTGNFFVCEYYGLNPDIITLAKALGGGAMPCGATIINAELDFDDKGRHANTSGGNYLAVAAALAVLDRFEREPALIQNVRDAGNYMWQRLHELSVVFNYAAEHRGGYTMSEPRGLGLMLAVDFDSAEYRNRVVDECTKRGLIVKGAGKRAVRFLPPLIINRKEVDIGISVFKKALEAAFGLNITYTPSDI